MFRLLVRAAATGLLGSMIAAVAVAALFSIHPELVLEMDRPIPASLESGWYPPERDHDYTFAWTSAQATLMLRGLSREAPWECVVRFRGARGGGQPQPQVNLAIDGIIASTASGTNEQQDVVAVAPRRPAARGLTLTIAAAPTVVPGGSDTRELGVQVDRVTCRPQAGEIVLAPRPIVLDAALAGALFGLALAFSGITFGSAILGSIVIGVAQALPLSTGPAPYSAFGDAAVLLAAWISIAMVLLTLAIERSRGRPLRNTARFAILFSGVSIYLQLLGLLHPSKLVIDAVFHAHRLEWVLGGRYFFTQPMPGGVSFPYAVGVYVFAAPWSLLTSDHVTLLRVVVTTAQVVAGALLYPLLARAWGDRVTAAIAVALFSLVPLPYELLGNANLANVFAQAIALVAVVAAAGWSLQRRQYGAAAGLFAITAFAFLSHVSTFAQLGVTLVVLAALYLWKGGPELRVPARWIGIVTVLAALFAVGLYYRHFTDVYVKALRVRTAASETVAPAPAATSVPARQVTRPLTGRVAGALALTRSALGWPILILAALGGWRLWTVRARDRATLAILAWSVAYVLFLGVGVMRVDAPFQRYAAEFVGRVVLATYPAAVMLAARGAGWGWHAGLTGRVAVSVLLLFAVMGGLRNWERWFT